MVSIATAFGARCSNSSIKAARMTISRASLFFLAVVSAGSATAQSRYEPSYRLSRVGLTDSTHTRGDGYQYSTLQFMNSAGHLLGYSDGFYGPTDSGLSVWMASRSGTTRLGLTDSMHTRTGGLQSSFAYFLNDAGQAAGQSYRFQGTSFSGQSAWLSSDGLSWRVGLVDASHTRSDGHQFSSANALSETGLLIGNSTRYQGMNEAGRSAWIANGSVTQRIGLVDAGHTSSDGLQNSDVRVVNGAGHAAGFSTRYIGQMAAGQSAWLAQGGSTKQIGFTDFEHTKANGEQISYASLLNTSGQVTGTSRRFDSTNLDLGTSAWLANANGTQKLGFTDSAHTREDGFRFSRAEFLNDAGHVAGSSNRFAGSSFAGTSAWLAYGADTQRVGLVDASHTRTDGFQVSIVGFLAESGHAVGQSERFTGAEQKGMSAWLAIDGTTQRIGLFDAEHTRADGHQDSWAIAVKGDGIAAGSSTRYFGENHAGHSAWMFSDAGMQRLGLTDALHTSSSTGERASWVFDFNEAGQATGHASRFSNGSSMGQSAWFFDSESGSTTVLSFSTRADGYAITDINFLGDDGLVLGRYELFSDMDSLGYHAFAWSPTQGFADLGTLIEGGLTDTGWLNLASVFNSQGGMIAGAGTFTELAGQAIYLLSPVPESSTYLLILTGLAALWFQGRKKLAGAKRQTHLLGAGAHCV